MGKKFIHLPELSEMLGVSVRTLREYIKRGELRASKIGRIYVVKPDHVDEFVSSKEVSQKQKRQ
jgi:excisionase family DNA binding protein